MNTLILAGDHSHASQRTGCAMCSAMHERGRDDFWNEPILESENFKVIPTLGALVPGWLLIVPKFHVLSMAEMSADEQAEYFKIKAETANLLEAAFGAVTFFEHGPSAVKKSTGCSVDHAHVHAVPGIASISKLTETLLGADGSFVPGGLCHCAQAVRRGNDYLMLEESGKPAVFVESVSFPSQIFRKAVAVSVNKETEYNWREYPQLEIVLRTTNFLKSILSK